MNQTLDGHRGVWTLSEIRDGKIHPVSYELLAWGRDLADKLAVELSAVILGHRVMNQVRELTTRGADRVYVVDNPELKFFNVDSCDKILRTLIREHKPEILLAPATSAGRALMPVLAAKLHTGLVSDCIGLDIDRSEGSLMQIRPVSGRKIIAAFKTPNHRPQMATLRPGSIQPPAADADRGGRIIRKEYPPELLASCITHLCFYRELAEQPENAPVYNFEDFNIVDDLVEVMLELDRKLSVCVGAVESV
jgi:electron transfer flavoprotein alpha subunit